MEISKLMQDFRDRLDENHISWTDNSDFWSCDDYVRVIERTYIDAVDDIDREPAYQCSVIFGWVMNPKTKEKESMTHGYPDKLECWIPQFYPEPEAMSIDEIMDILKKRKGEN